MPFDFSALVDCDRYPIGALDSAEGRALIAGCRASLARTAICVLPGFIRQAALARMAEEAESVAPLGHYLSGPRCSYELDETGDWPPGHPRRLSHDSSYRQVLSCHIRNDGLLRKLFLWPDLTDFVGRALGHEVLYTSACPFLALTLHVAGEGDRNGWHFDPNDGVVTLMLQKPDAGGVFEYAPYIRSDEAENYDGVSALFADPAGLAQRPAISAGDFVLFNGSRSMHRVSAVGPTKQRRIMAVFSYDQRPDMIFSQAYIDHVQSFPQDITAKGTDAS